MAKTPRRLLIATGNKGKLREFQAFLADLPIEVTMLSCFTGIKDIEETGSTFAENAQLKARGFARQAGLITLADDSGLEVNALDGRPGVLSARYGGVQTPFSKKMEMLLAELAETGEADRRARFVCSIAIANESGDVLHTTEGICSGMIAMRPRGTGGFGYDPLFVPDGFDRTFGELDDTVKAKISHRARSFLQIMPFLRGFYEI